MGGGIGGNFGRTKGSNPPVSKNSDVRYSQKKTTGYILNAEHPKGGSKAKFMKDVLGYTKSDSRAFHKNVVESITNLQVKLLTLHMGCDTPTTLSL